MTLAGLVVARDRSVLRPPGSLAVRVPCLARPAPGLLEGRRPLALDETLAARMRLAVRGRAPVPGWHPALAMAPAAASVPPTLRNSRRSIPGASGRVLVSFGFIVIPLRLGLDEKKKEQEKEEALGHPANVLGGEK